MMIADYRAEYPAREPPVLICADLQIEYLMEGRRHLLAGAESIAATCHEILTFWRRSLCPIVHLKRVAQAAWFNPASNLTDWIQQLKPKPGELAFEHPLPSAYSSVRFAEYMTNMKNLRCILLGFSLDETILSTAIDGYHRGHRYQIIKDAVACKNPRDGDPTAYRDAVMEVMSNYATFLKQSDLPAISAETGA